MDDLDREWKPSGRPQSTIALNFMSELDDLFKLDGGLDLLDKNVHQKKQAVTTHTQELEALEARLRAAEERLKQAKSSPPSRNASQRRTPLQGVFPDADKARVGEAGSPLAVRPKSRADPQAAKAIPGALSESPTSDNSTEYVLVDRPRTAQTDDGERA
ncbi:hypothetical protein K505DRAFT_327965 [Melanomma pulvis-pyrius CBS 109.77]|uniref:Uncharacterized protein n=1 Tax=Melanomma pulvis-pyrius CBS 109.77 TaxID=1314802 RepID=A0A6A6X121_9PLEO|nr:hypothetical protein K505DRAFT_327965 [Melanomma pulvis-pyrius CBS 109.77]